jgi:hypothetical protein
MLYNCRVQGQDKRPLHVDLCHTHALIPNFCCQYQLGSCHRSAYTIKFFLCFFGSTQSPLGTQIPRCIALNPLQPFQHSFQMSSQTQNKWILSSLSHSHRPLSATVPPSLLNALSFVQLSLPKDKRVLSVNPQTSNLDVNFPSQLQFLSPSFSRLLRLLPSILGFKCCRVFLH